MAEETKDNFTEQSSGLLMKAYDDLVHPSAKSLGNTLSFLPRAIGVWLSSLEKWIINGEEAIRLTAQTVKEKASKIPEEKLVEPKPYVVVPAIQQLSYCYNSKELRRLYSNLLISAMNADTHDEVHPAFVDIIRQLSPLEAQALNKIHTLGPAITMIDIKLNYGLMNYKEICMNYSIDLYPVFKSAYVMASSIQNIARLGLIELCHGKVMAGEHIYEVYDEEPILAEVNELYGADEVFVNYEKGYIKLTDFGILFCRICCDEENT